MINMNETKSNRSVSQPLKCLDIKWTHNCPFKFLFAFPFTSDNFEVYGKTQFVKLQQWVKVVIFCMTSIVISVPFKLFDVFTHRDWK